MRHRVKTLKLGRKTQHRHQMLANMVCSLIKAGRIETTVEKAKAARSLADKMVTLAKKGSLHHRRLAITALQQVDCVHKLFTEIGPRSAQRNGGYTRIIKLGTRIGDAANTALLEWVDLSVPATEESGDKKAESESKPAKKPAAKKKSAGATKAKKSEEKPEAA
jgi:large subunit ribosomal protein L17